MKTLAVTGGIGAGKSMLCRYLAEQGVPVYDSDSRTKTIYGRVPGLLKKVEDEFGCSFRDAHGSLDRSALAKVAFSDEESLSRLESIVHPVVLEDFRTWRSTFSEGMTWRYAGVEPFVVIESAIILQLPMFLEETDAVLLVDAPLELRVERACGRDGRSSEEVLARVKAQTFRKEDADAVVVNDSDLSTLKERTDFVLKNIIFA